MGNYRLFTDATADMNPDDVKALGLNIIPMDFTLNGEAFTHYFDERELSSAEFYSRLREGAVSSTVQINIARYEEYFEPALRAGEDILYLCFSSALSGTYQTSLIAAEELSAKYPGRKIVSVDTKCASVGEGLIAYAAALKYRDGCSFSELLAWVEENRGFVTHQFVVDDLFHLRRGGRVSSVSAVVGSALNIKPFLRVDDDGALFVKSKIRGRAKSIEALRQELDRNFDSAKLGVILIGHADCPENAETLAEDVRAGFPGSIVSVSSMGPVIGAHVGANTLALAFFGFER